MRRYSKLVHTGLYLAFSALLACGGGGGSSSSPTPVTGDAPTIALFAGSLDGPGSTDGTGVVARFNDSAGVATDNGGNVYVADTGNNTIRKITPAGIVTTLAGAAGVTGSANGIGAAASFHYPRGIAVDNAGNVYVADSGNNVIRKITSTGVVTTFAAGFSAPSGVSTDSVGNVYVADSGHYTIRKITPGGFDSTLAGALGVAGSVDGTGAAARFSYPQGVATDSAGNVYVADQFNGTIRKITSAGVVTTLAGTAGISGSADGTGGAASFSSPYGVATDSGGNVYVAEMSNNTIRRITPGGLVTTLAGTAGVDGHADGSGAAANFYGPEGIATDSTGNVYVADSINDTIRKITPAGFVTTLAGKPLVYGHDDGIGAAASFNGPRGIAADNTGNIYVGDDMNYVIRKITPTGVVSTLAGMAGLSGSADGVGAAARFNRPGGLATDSAGNIYVADLYNDTIRKITSAGLVTTLAGVAGVCGYSDGVGAAATFCGPSDVATDSGGNVYVADSGNRIIRKISPTGLVTTVAGSPGVAGNIDGDGASGLAKFNTPSAIAVDNAGNTYVTDNGTIRKITSGGWVTTLAGTAGIFGHTDGNGSAARFDLGLGIAVDRVGNIYVTDVGGQTIRKITQTGVVSTVVGVAGKRGFVSGSFPGGLNSPFGLAFSGSSLYISAAAGIAVVKNFP